MGEASGKTGMQKKWEELQISNDFLFGEGRHIYTFRNYCAEDKKIPLQDETTKIFLNAEGTKRDVGKELRDFLNYVAGRKPKNPFVAKLDEAVKKAKKNREWRHEYMTLLMRDQENVERGIAIGREEGKIYGAISTCRDLGISDHDILIRLQKKFYLSEEEAKHYLQLA